MSPDDPRHGSYAGATVHWADHEPLCDACHAEAARVRKRNRYRAHIGDPGMVPSLGTVRRIRALQVLGYSFTELARESGLPAKTLQNPMYRGACVSRATAETVAAVYDRLSMTPATSRYAERARRHAERQGWAPPLAWDDIDNDPEPYTEELDAQTRRLLARGRDTSANRAEDAEWLADADENLTGACARLGLSPDSLWTACYRAGRLDVYDRLARRELDGEMRVTVREAKRATAA